MTTEMDLDSPVYDMCMAGFILANTLSENGGVTRGVCELDAQEYLQRVKETYEIQYQGERLTACDEAGQPAVVWPDQYVSMNMWGLPPQFLDILESGFVEFLDQLADDACKTEYLLPKIIDKLLKAGKAKVKLLETRDRWFGVTYQEG